MRVGDGFGSGGRFILRIKGREVSAADAGEVVVEKHLCRGVPVLPPDEHRVSAWEPVEFITIPGGGAGECDDADETAGEDDIFG